MKLLFDYCQLISDDWGDVKLGIGWYRHAKAHKWFGFDIVFYLIRWRVSLTFVSNWIEYDKKINRWKYRTKK